MKINTDPKKIKELLERGVEEVIIKDHLEKRLMAGEQLRVKFGIDPTAPDLHLGHAVPLRKLKQFQDLGHQIVLIVGDFTAMIGDPSGRNELRKPLTREDVERNKKNYLNQAGKIIDVEKTEVHHNSEWFDKEGVATFYDLASKITVQRVLERDDFKKRLRQDQDVSMIEIIYPLLQGYDSVKISADLEIGGTDQKFNLLMGRKIQRRYGQPEQDIMTNWLLEGTDGVQKMSKSLGNYIGINEPAKEMFAKIMSISDGLMVKYFRVLTDMPQEQVDKLLKASKSLGFGGFNPRDLKAELAREIIEIYHGKEQAIESEREFNRVFKEKKLPSEIASVELAAGQYNILDFLVKIKLAPSKAEAKRLVVQGGIKLNGQVEKDWQKTVEIETGSSLIIQAGKRKFAKVLSKKE